MVEVCVCVRKRGVGVNFILLCFFYILFIMVWSTLCYLSYEKCLTKKTLIGFDLTKTTKVDDTHRQEHRHNTTEETHSHTHRIWTLVYHLLVNEVHAPLTLHNNLCDTLYY